MVFPGKATQIHLQSYGWNQKLNTLDTKVEERDSEPNLKGMLYFQEKKTG